MDHSNRNVIYKEISSEDAENPDFRSAVSDDACGEPERSEGNRQQVNGLPLTCVKKRKPKKSQLVADFYRFDFLQAKKWSHLSESNR